MRTRRKASYAAAALALAACGGGEIIAIVSFVGSAGGDWVVDDPAAAGFQPRADCGAGGNSSCVVNIQTIGSQNLYATDFGLSYTGTLPGCPAGAARTDGTVRGERISLPGCFSGRYLSINEAVSDDGSIRAFFDSFVPPLATGVWVEIQRGERRFKFSGNDAGCELTPARPAVAVTIVPADLGVPRLQTEITAFTVGSETWSGRFVGVSGMRLTRGGAVMELQREDRPDSC